MVRFFHKMGCVVRFFGGHIENVPAIAVLFALLAQFVFAASGDYAFQAKKYLSQGRYGAAYGQYILALKESKKEADLVAEGRILTAMSNLATSAMEYEEAKKLLDKVKVEALDQNGKEDFYRTYMEFYNAQENYNAADEYSQKEKFKEPTAAYLGEQAIAAAGKGKGEITTKLTDGKSFNALPGGVPRFGPKKGEGLARIENIGSNKIPTPFQRM
ncbi:hypothetical protein AGMMS49938_17990 [Fibrobacterales bacterium]|nr:hypothetical protein AGMMS49938_17990 [Fibrobacterales bacterium]